MLISIHVLREEDDFSTCADTESDHRLFQSTSSARRTTRASAALTGGRRGQFQSTSSARRTTAKVHKKPVHLLRKRYNHFPAGRCNPLYSGKTETSTFNSLAIKC